MVIYLGVLDKDYKIKVDIITGFISGDIITFAFKDQNISNINIEFVKNGDPINITDFAFIANIRKPDTLLTPFEVSIIDAENGLGIMDLPLELTTDIGTYTFEIEIKKDNEISHTDTYTYKVRETLSGDIDDSIVVDEDYNLLIKLVDNVNKTERDIKASEKQRVIDENQRKSSEEVRIANEKERQRSTTERLERVDAAIAAGTNDLETKEARRDVKGVEHATLRECMIANYNYLNSMNDVIFETVEG